MTTTRNTPHQQPREHKLIEVASKCQPAKEAAKQLLVGVILLFFYGVELISSLLVECQCQHKKSYLASHYEISVHCHGTTIGDEIGDWFHNVPRILPPGEAGQNPKLSGHVGQPSPQHQGRPLLCFPAELQPNLQKTEAHALYSQKNTSIGNIKITPCTYI